MNITAAEWHDIKNPLFRMKLIQPAQFRTLRNKNTFCTSIMLTAMIVSIKSQFFSIWEISGVLDKAHYTSIICVCVLNKWTDSLILHQGPYWDDGTYRNSQLYRIQQLTSRGKPLKQYYTAGSNQSCLAKMQNRSTTLHYIIRIINITKVRVHNYNAATLFKDKITFANGRHA